jgi:hypothetical protein
MSLRILAVAAVITLACVQAASAQNVHFSRWQTRYETAGFGWVNAELTLNEFDGHYVANTGARGRLVDVYIGPPGPGGPIGTTEVSGRWVFQNGEQGTFKFRVNSNGTAFGGLWYYDGPGAAYRWEGRRVSSGPVPPINP